MENSQKTLSEIERLEEQIKQKKALIAKKRARLQQKQKKEARALDTRRKILVGAIVLRKAETDPEWLTRLTSWLDEGLTEERNRALFPGLPKRENE
jgi:hypothetical protein